MTKQPLALFMIMLMVLAVGSFAVAQDITADDLENISESDDVAPEDTEEPEQTKEDKKADTKDDEPKQDPAAQLTKSSKTHSSGSGHNSISYEELAKLNSKSNSQDTKETEVKEEPFTFTGIIKAKEDGVETIWVYFDGAVIKELTPEKTLPVETIEPEEPEDLGGANVDLNNDGIIDEEDLNLLIDVYWGPCDDGAEGVDCIGDFNNDGIVNTADLLILLTQWTESTPNILTECGQITEPGQYFLTSSVNSPDTCFRIKADDVSLNCKGHTITYGGVAKGHGIVNNGYNNLEVTQCNIHQSTILQSSQIDKSHAIKLKNAAGHNIYHNDLSTNTLRSAGIFLNNVQQSVIQKNYVFTDEFRAMGVVLKYSNEIAVSHNILKTEGTKGHGIITGSSDSNYIFDNAIETSGSKAHALVIGDGSANVVEENALTTSGQDANAVVSRRIVKENRFISNLITSARGHAFKFNPQDETNKQTGNELISNTFNDVEKNHLQIEKIGSEMELITIDQSIGPYNLAEDGLTLDVRKTGTGEVLFYEASGSGRDLDEDVIIGLNLVDITTSKPGLDTPAHITLLNLPEFESPLVFKNDAPCDTDCEDVIVDLDKADFEILNAGTYYVSEDPSFGVGGEDDAVVEEITELSGGSGSSFAEATQYSEWSACTPEGIQTRTKTERLHSGQIVESEETQPCAYEEQTTTNGAEQLSAGDQLQGFVSRLTGAVIGGSPEVRATIVLFFLAALILAYFVVALMRRRA